MAISVRPRIGGDEVVGCLRIGPRRVLGEHQIHRARRIIGAARIFGVATRPSLGAREGEIPPRDPPSCAQDCRGASLAMASCAVNRQSRKLLKKPQTRLRLRFDFELSVSSGSGQELETETIRSRCGFTN
jgi:hypothetical protein